ncbi:PREDICTED: uncharacterized protein LOC107334177 isoform X2 [Acropora digitifera]|uniref:uncharacterized protein LOC107334177 isoform X2 n=1 Tax=Acropora digitifera TaxID=70779 RepID=UPI00077ADFE1|nr:PREDICTED: uncharacterized protein LOC107334177 isoform X2 [Acropora digitifera]
MAACGGRLLRTSRLGQISQARIRITQPRRNISSSGAEKQGSLLRRVITDWKTPSIMFLTGVAGCLFYERFIEEPDETGTRDVFASSRSNLDRELYCPHFLPVV